MRVVFESINEALNLIDDLAVVTFPGAPLLTVDGAELAVFICPLVPDADAVFLKVGDIGLSLEEPEQLVNNGAQMKFLGGEAGEPFAQIVTGLAAENRDGASACAVCARLAVIKNVSEEIEVLLHRWRLEI